MTADQGNCPRPASAPPRILLCATGWATPHCLAPVPGTRLVLRSPGGGGGGWGGLLTLLTLGAASLWLGRCLGCLPLCCCRWPYCPQPSCRGTLLSLGGGLLLGSLQQPVSSPLQPPACCSVPPCRLQTTRLVQRPGHPPCSVVTR